VANISANPGVLFVAIFCYLANFIGDIVISWALYYFFVPVNRAVSLLAALVPALEASSYIGDALPTSPTLPKFKPSRLR